MHGRKRILESKLIYCISMNADVEVMIKSCSTCPDYKSTQPMEKVMSNERPGWSWESVKGKIFTIKLSIMLMQISYSV